MERIKSIIGVTFETPVSVEKTTLLSEALLDAEVRIGDLFRQMPKAPGTRTDLQPPQTTTGKSSEMEPRFIDEPRLTPKQEAAKKFGFDSNQVKRFETLASNPDLVELVKAEARENDEKPPRCGGGLLPYVPSFLRQRLQNSAELPKSPFPEN